MYSPFFGAVHKTSDDDVHCEEGVHCEGDIHVSGAHLSANSWYDDKNPGRPYMRITGECRSIRGKMPYGVTKLTFKEGKGIPVDIFYEFSDDELASMVKKGLYRSRFKCPEEIRTNVLDMPITCNFIVVAPQKGSNVPILFADIADKHNIVTNSDDCGYVFGDYFKEAEEPEVEDDFLDFADVELEDDLFEQPEDDKVEEVVEEPEPAEETEIDKHYDAIYERVIEDHLDQLDTSLNEALADNKSAEPETEIAEEVQSTEVDVDEVLHDALISNMTDVDELLTNGALTDLSEDRDYRMGEIDELFRQNPDVVIARLEQVAAYEPSVEDVVKRAKAEAKRMAAEAEASQSKKVPQHMLDMAEEAEKAKNAEFDDFDDALE